MECALSHLMRAVRDVNELSLLLKKGLEGTEVVGSFFFKMVFGSKMELAIDEFWGRWGTV